MNGAAATGPEFHPDHWLALFQRGEHEALCEEFIRVLRYFEGYSFSSLGTAENEAFINTFMELFLALWTQEALKVAERHTWTFIDLNHTIANLAALSRFGTTDAFVRRLMEQGECDLVKMLALLSARSGVEVDRTLLFETNADMASHWYGAYATMFNCVADAGVAENLRAHFHFKHAGLGASHRVADVMYGSTYAGGGSDEAIKPVMNGALQRWLGETVGPVKNRAVKKKIAVLSGTWYAGHSSARIYNGFFEALRGKYDLTLVQLGEGAEASTAMFDRVIRAPRMREAEDFAALAENDFQMAIYPEVGMRVETVVLSNWRLAPIQVSLLGHSVSTWGSRVDYCVSGAACEVKEHPERHYSERLVLLPGMGVVHERPDYARKGHRATSGPLVINCPWTSQKIHSRLVETLGRLAAEVKAPALFRVFVAGSTKWCNDHVLLHRRLSRALSGHRVELVPEVAYEVYMELLEQGDFTLDSFHFGGCNTISDALWVRSPTITWEGEAWYNRIGSEMVRRAGLGECVARSEEEYVGLARRMIEDGPWRESLRARLEAADLEGTIYGAEEAGHFAAAVDYLMEHHERLRAEDGRSPVRIFGA